MKRIAWLFVTLLLSSSVLGIFGNTRPVRAEIPDDACFFDPGVCTYEYFFSPVAPLTITAINPESGHGQSYQYNGRSSADGYYYFGYQVPIGGDSEDALHSIAVRECDLFSGARFVDFRQNTSGDYLDPPFDVAISDRVDPRDEIPLEEKGSCVDDDPTQDNNNIRFNVTVTDIPENIQAIAYRLTIQLHEGGPTGTVLESSFDQDNDPRVWVERTNGRTSITRGFLLEERYYGIEEGKEYVVCIPELKELPNGGCSETKRKETGLLTLTLSMTAEQANVLVQTAQPTPQPSCSGLAFFASIACAVIQGLYSFLSWIYQNGVIDNLHVDPLRGPAGDEQDQTLYDIWNNFRIIANILFIIVFLLAMFGQAFSFVFSAYELKKIMPRLVIGVIGVQLSWYLVGFLVDIFNILGAGMRALILAPVDGLDLNNLTTDNPAINASVITVLLGGGALALGKLTFLVKGLLLFLPPLLLALTLIVVLALLVVVFRKILILVLIVTAPVAIVLWILPNTERYAKTWWDFLIKALVMYPLIVGLIAGGELLAKLLVAESDPSPQEQIAGIVALFAPFFLIPQTFKFAGNVIANVASGFDRTRKMAGSRAFGDVRNPFSYRGRRREYMHQAYNQGAAQFVDKNRQGFRGGMKSMQLRRPGTWVRPFTGLAAMGYAKIAPSVDETIAKRNKEAFEWAERSGSYDAGTLFAQLGSTNNLFTGKSLDPLYVNEAQAHLNDMSRTAAAMAILMNKAGSYQEVDAVRQTLAANKHFTDEQKDRIWQTATISDYVKNVHGDMRYRDWRDGGMKPTKALEFVRKSVDQEPDYAIKTQQASFWQGQLDSKQIVQSMADGDEKTRAIGHYNAFYKKVSDDIRGKKQMILNSDMARTDLEATTQELVAAGQLDASILRDDQGNQRSFVEYRQHERGELDKLRNAYNEARARRPDLSERDARATLPEYQALQQASTRLGEIEGRILNAYAVKKGFQDADLLAATQYESRQPPAAREALWRYLKNGDTGNRQYGHVEDVA